MQIYTKCTGFTKLREQVPKVAGDSRELPGRGTAGGKYKKTLGMARGITGSCRGAGSAKSCRGTGGKLSGKVVGKKNARDWARRNMLNALLREIMVPNLLRTTEVGHQKSNFQHVQSG